MDIIINTDLVLLLFYYILVTVIQTDRQMLLNTFHQRVGDNSHSTVGSLFPAKGSVELVHRHHKRT